MAEKNLENKNDKDFRDSKQIKTTICFKSTEEREIIRNYAKNKHNLSFSDYVRMLIEEDMKGEKRIKEIEEIESKTSEKFEKNMQVLIRKIDLLESELKEIKNYNINRVLSKEFRTQEIDLEKFQVKIMEFFNTHDKATIFEIAEYFNESGEKTQKCLDILEESKKLRLYYNGMKYGRYIQ